MKMKPKSVVFRFDLNKTGELFAYAYTFFLLYFKLSMMCTTEETLGFGAGTEPQAAANNNGITPDEMLKTLENELKKMMTLQFNMTPTISPELSGFMNQHPALNNILETPNLSSYRADETLGDTITPRASASTFMAPFSLPTNVGGLYMLDPNEIQSTPFFPSSHSALPANPYEEEKLRGTFNRMPKANTPTQYYDYIVVGGGAVGCPVARTLAEGGKDVFLIERGSERTYTETPLAMDIYGAGLSLNDDKISQLLVTKNGVRTHIGNVMGGGTAINIGIMIEETEEYFKYLQNAFPQMKWDSDLLKHSFDWVAKRAANPMPVEEPYGIAWHKGLQNINTPYYKSYTDENKSNYKDLGDYSIRFQPGYHWRSYSLFNHSMNFYRHASDVLLGGSDYDVNSWDKRPNKLKIITGHTVHKVQFDMSKPVSEATCVLYKATSEADFSPIHDAKQYIFGIPIPNSSDVLFSLFNPLKAIQTFLKWYRGVMVEDKSYRACIRPGGRIILSAGAVLTPALLFKSGIGPHNQLKELGAEPVQINEDLGKYFSDRVLIPIGIFFKKSALHGSEFPARICQGIGAKNIGPDCSNFRIGEQSLKCTLATAEELSGGRIAEGVIYSTRYIFPPEWRNEPFVDFVFNVLRDCSKGKSPYNSIALASTCTLAAPVIDCFRRVAANFYFTAEPKSRGSVKMKKDGTLLVDANYMGEEQDLFDAIRGVSNIIKIVNSHAYKGIIEPIGAKSCPVYVLNGILDLLLQFGSQSDNYVFDKSERFDLVVKHIQDLIPPEYQRPDSTQRTNDRYSAINNASTIGMERYLQELQSESSFENAMKENSSESNGEVKESCNASDVYNYFYNFDQCGLVADGPAISNTSLYSASNNSTLTTNAKDDLFNIYGQSNNGSEVLRGALFMHYAKQQIFRPYSKQQWAATYPPVLPNPEDPIAVAKYIANYMTSIWHHTGTAQFGKVVDENFDVYNITGLSIIDASVLNFVTRMNPTATLLMLGRYAGLTLLKNANVPIDNLINGV